MANSKINIDKINKVIVAMPDRLGDTIFYTPIFRLLKTIKPVLRVDVIAPTQLCVSVLQNNPRINKIFLQPSEKDLLALKNQYDLAIDVDDSKISSVAIRQIANNPLIIIRGCHCQTHMAEQSLQFCADQFDYNLDNFARYYELYPDENNFVKVKTLLEEYKVNFTRDKLIALHMGCHGLAKKRTRLWKKLYHQKAWPVKNFVKLAKELINVNHDVKFILTGAKEEYKLANIFCKKIPGTISLINKTSVLDLAALMSFLTLYISNDTGSVHVASSTEVPLIALYLSSSYKVFGPYPKSPDRIVLKSKEGKIVIERVLQAAKKFI